MSAHARAGPWLLYGLVALVAMVGCSSSTSRDQNWGSDVGRGDASVPDSDDATTSAAGDDASPEVSPGDAAEGDDLSDASDNPAPEAGSADTISLDATDDQDPADVTSVRSAN
jgi:hypothetical protein